MARWHRSDPARLQVSFCDGCGVSTAAERARRRMDEVRAAALTGGLGLR